MEGHEMMQSNKKLKTTSTFKPDDSEELYYGENESSDASARIENTNRVPPPKDFSASYMIEVNKPKFSFPDKSPYTGGSYTSSNNILELSTTEGIPIIDTYGEYHRIPLTGPMVVKVYVDGTPVKDENQNLPEDEDLKQYKLTKTVFQNL